MDNLILAWLTPVRSSEDKQNACPLSRPSTFSAVPAKIHAKKTKGFKKWSF